MSTYPKTQTQRILSPLRLAFWKAAAFSTGIVLRRKALVERVVAHLPLMVVGVVAFFGGRFVGQWVLELLF